MALKSEGSTTPDYVKSIESTRKARYINAVFCGIGILLAGAAAILYIGTPYSLFSISCAFLVVIALGALLLKSLTEAKASLDIVRTSVYAALLSSEQRKTIKRYLMRRGNTFYFTTYILYIVPVCIILTTLFYMTGNKAYLLFMALFALICLMLVLISSMYLSVRLNHTDTAVIISSSGILVDHEVLLFKADRGEALHMLRFSDYYYLKYVRTTLLGVKYLSEIIFPTNGILRTGLAATPDEEIVKALYLTDIFVTEDPFYESRQYLDEEEMLSDEDPNKELDSRPVKIDRSSRAARAKSRKKSNVVSQPLRLYEEEPYTTAEVAISPKRRRNRGETSLLDQNLAAKHPAIPSQESIINRSTATLPKVSPTASHKTPSVQIPRQTTLHVAPQQETISQPTSQIAPGLNKLESRPVTPITTRPAPATDKTTTEHSTSDISDTKARKKVYREPSSNELEEKTSTAKKKGFLE